MSVYPELDSLDLQELMQWWHDSPLDGEEYAIAYYDELAFNICDQGGTEFLLQEITQADPPRLAAILAHLPAHPQLQTVAYLQHEQPLIVARAIDRLRMETDLPPIAPTLISKVLSLRSHPDAYVRGAVLRFASQMTPESAVPLLLEGLNDPNYLVRMSAIDELDELPCVEAVSDIQPLLNDPHEFVREAARSAIAHLTNEPVGFSTRSANVI
jgi:HEAT repeat protein